MTKPAGFPASYLCVGADRTVIFNFAHRSPQMAQEIWI